MNGAATISAVSIGSQIMHMLTVILDYILIGPMGLAPALGSLLSAVICAGIYLAYHKKWRMQ